MAKERMKINYEKEKRIISNETDSWKSHVSGLN
jgi:hypothetical protein